MAVEVHWTEEADGNYRADVRLAGKLFSQSFHGDFRSPYNPWVIQVRKQSIETWDDGTAISPDERAKIWTALQQHRCPAESQYRED